MHNLIQAVLSLILLLTVSACAEVGFIASPIQNFSGKDSILLTASRSDILDIAAEVGKSMGFYVSALDRDRNIVSLSSGSSFAIALLIGKTSDAILTINSNDKGKKLDVDIWLMGNFGTGGQDEAEGLLKEFRIRLLQKIGHP